MPRDTDCVDEARAAPAPAPLPVAEARLSQTTTHLFWDGGGGGGLPVRAACGVDQGCPLAPAFFAISDERTNAAGSRRQPAHALFSFSVACFLVKS